MAPTQPLKRKQQPSASPQRSPIKRRKLGITLAQKQTLIENLQLEITERARRLRAQYNLQAQQMRSRVEMRVNRIPRKLRRLRMDELPEKLAQMQKQSRLVSSKPLPGLPKDETSSKQINQKPLPTTSKTAGTTRSRNEHSGRDKENNQNEVVDVTKKSRGPAGHAKASVAPSQVLSPTSGNTRMIQRNQSASPTKPTTSRLASPVKSVGAKAASGVLSSTVDKTKTPRPGVMTSASTTANAATAAGRTLKAAAPLLTASAQGGRKGSVSSESSEELVAAIVKKKTSPTASKITKTAPISKKTEANSTKSATAKKTPAAKAATAGRALRKRA